MNSAQGFIKPNAHRCREIEAPFTASLRDDNLPLWKTVFNALADAVGFAAEDQNVVVSEFSLPKRPLRFARSRAWLDA